MNDESPRWSNNVVLDAFAAAGFPDHDAAIVLALLVERRECEDCGGEGVVVNAMPWGGEYLCPTCNGPDRQAIESPTNGSGTKDGTA